MKPKPEIFHHGEAVPRKLRGPGDAQEEIEASTRENEISEKARAALEELFRVIEQEHKTPYFVFDLDGTLFPYGQESAFNPETFEEYVGHNRDLVDAFKRKISGLAKRGFRIAINTGRPAHIAQKAARYLFPPDSVETIIGENGAVFAKREDGRDATRTPIEYAPYFSQEQVESFHEACKSLMAFCRAHGGHLAEEGKLVGITFHPDVAGVSGEEAEKKRRAFCEEVKREADRTGLSDRFDIHYPGSVDITPKGVTKARTAREVLGRDSIKMHFGDTSSDEEAMGEAEGNVAPGNAAPSTKAQAQKADIGLVAERNDLKGVLDSLSLIEAYIRMRNIKKIRKAKEEGNSDTGE